MTKKEAKEAIEGLKKEIKHHRYLYHVLDREEISDAALDSLKRKLQKLEEENPEFITTDSPTQRVGGKPLNKFKKVGHEAPMLSLFDAFSEKEMGDWEERLLKILASKNKKKNLDYFVELKLDGLAISLTYENGKFLVGATRGDGKVGEDVTNNLKTIEAIPLSLRIPKESELKKEGFLKKQIESILKEVETGKINIRGEAIMTKKAFLKLNKEFEKAGKQKLANTRNGAAGSIRQLDPKIAVKRKLDFYTYEIKTDVGLEKNEEKRKLLNLLGFKTLKENKLSRDLKGVFEIYKKVMKTRDNLPFDIDGLVVKVNNLSLWDMLGVVGKGPRYMMAYKFPAEQTTTKLKDVVWQVGRTGVLTPTATFDPVEIGGVTVSRATLHNMDEIKRLGLKIGDTVIIERAGDVIPKVIKVLINLRTGREKEIDIPKKCPICSGKVEKVGDEVAFRCTSKDCYAVTLRGIMHWVSRGAVDIEGLGGKIVEQLLQSGLIRDLSDLYALEVGDLVPLERFADKSADNLIDALEEKKNIELSRFIFGLGIRHVGEETALILAKKFFKNKKIKKEEKISIDELAGYFKSLDREDLKEINDVGPIVAQSISNWWNDQKNQIILSKLKKNGVKLKVDTRLREAALGKSGKLTGKKFVLTGSLSGLTRDEAKDRIRTLGGNVSSQVSKNTDFIVAGADPGSKFAKGKKLGIKIIDEKEFLKIVS